MTRTFTAGGAQPMPLAATLMPCPTSSAGLSCSLLRPARTPGGRSPAGDCWHDGIAMPALHCAFPPWAPVLAAHPQAHPSLSQFRPAPLADDGWPMLLAVRRTRTLARRCSSSVGSQRLRRRSRPRCSGQAHSTGSFATTSASSTTTAPRSVARAARPTRCGVPTTMTRSVCCPSSISSGRTHPVCWCPVSVAPPVLLVLFIVQLM